MAEYRVTGPDGASYKVTGPDGASDADVLAQVKAYKPPASMAPDTAPDEAEKLPAVKAPAPKAAPASATPAAKAPGSETAGFVGGNLAKGVANIAGLPVDAARNLANLGIAGYGTAAGAMGGTPPDLLPPGPGGSDWIQTMMRKAGVLGRDAEPESGLGRYAASALQMLPGAAIGRPVNPGQAVRAGSAAASSGVGAEAAADIGGEEWRGVGAMAPGAMRLMKPPTTGERATEQRQGEKFAKAKEAGISVPPREMKADRPQQSIQDMVNKELGQPAGAEISPKTLKAYNKLHWDDYEAVIKSPALAKGVKPTAAFQKEIQGIGNEIQEARGTLPQTFQSMQPVLKLLGEYGYGALPPGTKGTIPPRAQPIPPNVAMRAIKKLRSDATTNLTSDKPESKELGLVQRRIAGSLENLIEENLGTSAPDLMGRFRDARTAIAKSHDVEAALDPVTRKVSAARLSQLMTEGRPLSGGLKDIAEMGGEFPRAMREPKAQDIFTHRVTPMAIQHPPAAAAHWAARLTDPLTMTKPYQALFVDPRTKLSPEQQSMLRYFMAAQQANRPGELAAPPQ